MLALQAHTAFETGSPNNSSVEDLHGNLPLPKRPFWSTGKLLKAQAQTHVGLEANGTSEATVM